MKHIVVVVVSTLFALFNATAESPVVKTTEIKVADVGKLRGIGFQTAKSHDAGLALFERLSDGEDDFKKKPHYYGSGEDGCWFDVYGIIAKKDQDKLIAKARRLLINSPFNEVVLRFYEERSKKPNGTTERADGNLLRAVQLLKRKF